jgi:hypothetical protein
MVVWYLALKYDLDDTVRLYGRGKVIRAAYVLTFRSLLSAVRPPSNLTLLKPYHCAFDQARLTNWL